MFGIHLKINNELQVCRRCLRSTRSAFTLVELLIVAVLMSIAAVIAIPMLSETDGIRLQAAARLLMADLAFAQIDSITHADDTCIVTFDSATATYTIARTSAPSTPITNPGDNQSYVTQFGIGRAAQMTGVTIQSYSLDGDNKLGFGIFGELDQTAAATITLLSGGSTITVQVDSITGETSIP